LPRRQRAAAAGDEADRDEAVSGRVADAVSFFIHLSTISRVMK
jgi:hypothetical protein